MFALINRISSVLCLPMAWLLTLSPDPESFHTIYFLLIMSVTEELFQIHLNITWTSVGLDFFEPPELATGKGN